MSALGQDHGHGEADMAAPRPERTASPRGAEVYFHDPIYDIRVPQPFTAQIGLRRMGIAPAALVGPMPRQNHLLVNVDTIDLCLPIPSADDPIHLAHLLTPKPGTLAPRPLMGDHVPMRHAPPMMSKKMTPYVR